MSISAVTLSSAATTPTWSGALSARRSPTPLAVLARGGMIDGSARQLLYLLRHLDRERFPPLVILDVAGPLTSAIEAIGVPVRVMPMRPWRSLRGLPFRRRDARAIGVAAATHGAAIVHCSETWRTCYAASAAAQLGARLVVHVRGPVTSRDLAKNACLGADAIVAIADRYRDDIVAAGYPGARTSVVNDAVDPADYRRDARGGADFRAAIGAGREFVVGMVGRIEPFKRVLEFVDAIARVPAGVDATYVLIGATTRDAYVDEVRRRIALHGLEDRVRFAGRRDDVAAVLSGLDLLVTLSGGSVMFEAQACGVPVLSVRTDDRHSRHTRHDATGWCVTSDQPQPAADAIVTLLGDDARRFRLGAAGRDYVLEHLAPEVLARQTTAIYDAVLAAAAAR